MTSQAGSNQAVTPPTCGVCEGAARRSSLTMEAARRARYRDEVGRLIGIRRHVRRLWRGDRARERLGHMQYKILSQTFESGDANAYYNSAGYMKSATTLKRLQRPGNPPTPPRPTTPQGPIHHNAGDNDSEQPKTEPASVHQRISASTT